MIASTETQPRSRLRTGSLTANVDKHDRARGRIEVAAGKNEAVKLQCCCSTRCTRFLDCQLRPVPTCRPRRRKVPNQIDNSLVASALLFLRHAVETRPNTEAFNHTSY